MALFLSQYELSNETLLKLNSFLFWSVLYLYVAIRSPNQSPEYCSRVITLLHGSVATIVGLKHCNLYKLSANSFNAQTEPKHFALMLWSWGYFAFDLMWCLVSWTESSLMLCHHMSALIAITLYLRKSHTGCTFGCTIAMLECTNPLLQTRWLLRNEGHDKTLLFHVIEIVYLVLFMFLRGVVGSYIVFKVISCDKFNADEKILSLVFYVVSVFFMHEIVGYVFHKYKNTAEKARERFLASMQNWTSTIIQRSSTPPPPPPPETGGIYQHIITGLLAFYHIFVGKPLPIPPAEQITQYIAPIVPNLPVTLEKVSEVTSPMITSFTELITTTVKRSLTSTTQ